MFHISRALQNNLVKIHNAGYHIYGENFKLKLCTSAQSMALGTHTKSQLEILTRSTISAIHKFQENILESFRNLCKTTPCYTRARAHFPHHSNVAQIARHHLMWIRPHWRTLCKLEMLYVVSINSASRLT